MSGQNKEELTETKVGDVTRADIANVLREFMKKRTESDGAGWTEETLFADTGLNSFDAIECIFELEEHYGIDIDFNANNPEVKMERIGDFIDMATRSIIARRKT